MASCFLCGSSMTPRFAARDHLRLQVAIEYTVEWCSLCRFGAVAGSFTPGEVAAFYTPDYYTHGAQSASGRAAMSLLDRLRMHLAWRADRGVDLSPAEVEHVQPRPTLCDVGCGSGQAMAAFKHAGYDVVGVEPDPAARALAAAIGTVFAGTAEALPAAIADRQFDVVLLSHVLEHCIHPATALRNVKTLLAPRGTAIIEAPNNAAMGFEMYGPAWFFSDIPRHLQFFTETSIRKALRLAGLQLVKVIYTGYTRQFSPEWLSAQRAIRSHIGLDRSGDWKGSLNRLLASTLFAPPATKYDSIRVHAVHLD